MPNYRNRRDYTNIHEVDFLRVGGHYSFLHDPSAAELSGTILEMFVNRQDENDILVSFELDSDGQIYDFILDELSFEGEDPEEEIEKAMFPVKFLKIHPDAQLPVYSTDGSSGMDFFAVDDYYVRPNQFVLLNTGLQIELPTGIEMQLRSRSSWRKRGLLGADVGTIDYDYRGEVMFTYWNISAEGFEIHKGDKIGQGVLAPVIKGTPLLVDELSDTQRGTGGFGSTGK